jgi:hypothetical protein
MSSKSYTFRDADLKSTPLKLLNGAGKTLSYAGISLPSLKGEVIEQQAMERAQLDDWGTDSFREPLEHYVDAVEAEANLNTFGRIAVKEMLIRSLVSRLKLTDWHKQHPAVANEVIHQPWIILGLPRTGTSLLSILLGLNPTARPLLHWEAATPIPPADMASAAEDERIAQCNEHLEQLFRINPAIRAMHPFGAMLAEECTALFMYDLRTLGVESQAYVPSFGKWLAAADMSPAYRVHKQTLQSLQAAQPTEQWVLKSPNHLWCLQDMLAAYPDARIIWTHRAPADIVTSLGSLTNTLQRPFTSQQNHRAVANDWKGKITDAINKATIFDDSRSDDWCFHLRYEDLTRDPTASMERILAHFGQPLGSLHQQRITRWLEYRPKDVYGKHSYDPGDFGWSAEQLSEEYRDYQQDYC